MEVIEYLVQTGFKQSGNLLAHVIKKDRGSLCKWAQALKVHFRLRTFLQSLLTFHLSPSETQPPS